MAVTAERESKPVVARIERDYLRYSEELLNVSPRQVTIMAAISTAILFGILWAMKLAGLGKIAGLGWIITLFLERSILQYASTLAFFAGVWFLVLKLPQINKEMNGFSLIDFPELDSFLYGPDTADIVAKRIAAMAPEQGRLVIIRRFNTALQRLIHTQDTSEVHAVLNTMSDIDHEIADASFRSVRFAVWFIPVSGFLGTVLGISQAIAGFAGVVGGEGAISLEAIRPLLANATYNLGVAFDTTLLALVFSSLLMLAMYYVQRREEVFLSAVDEFCVSEIVNKSFAPDPGTSRLLDGMEEFKNVARNLTELTGHLGGIVERGKAVENFVAGLGELTNLSKILKSNQDALELMRASTENQQIEMRTALQAQQKELRTTLSQVSGDMRSALVQLHQEMRDVLSAQQAQTRDVLTEQQAQTRAALEQNKKAFDQLLPPLEELSTGIKIKVGQ